jgi:hypothetical protein
MSLSQSALACGLCTGVSITAQPKCATASSNPPHPAPSPAPSGGFPAESRIALLILSPPGSPVILSALHAGKAPSAPWVGPDRLDASRAGRPASAVATDSAEG